MIKTLIFGSNVAGYPSLFAGIFFLGGIQLISLGIIGEYLGRVFIETKERPLYFIQEYSESGHVGNEPGQSSEIRNGRGD
ncbi:Undecaprenyl-phosphate 4-deoxy-4-formamido-L-arabinose transferase [bioreactor metagenome]|uniref:Undecaprenyl-phosphate 4-deoxy-4-formamido-L-arabinose transferase n=1 Tax=bioreactor metagenome TaxID=1076179 RepID=A0A645G9A5_9ZZZZ